MVTTNTSPGIVKMLTSGPEAPVHERQSVLSRPAFGPASITQANAPRNGGVTNEAMTTARTAPLAGRSVRAVSQASGAPTAIEASPTQNASTIVFHSALLSAGSLKTSR